MHGIFVSCLQYIGAGILMALKLGRTGVSININDDQAMKIKQKLMNVMAENPEA